MNLTGYYFLMLKSDYLGPDEFNRSSVLTPLFVTVDRVVFIEYTSDIL
jgi:hypothetical protein